MCRKWVCIIFCVLLLGIAHKAVAGVVAVQNVTAASEPKPASGIAGVALNTTLSWTDRVGAQSHNVYFGTTSPGTFRGNQTETTFNPGPQIGRAHV